MRSTRRAVRRTVRPQVRAARGDIALIEVVTAGAEVCGGMRGGMQANETWNRYSQARSGDWVWQGACKSAD